MDMLANIDFNQANSKTTNENVYGDFLKEDRQTDGQHKNLPDNCL